MLVKKNPANDGLRKQIDGKLMWKKKIYQQVTLDNSCVIFGEIIIIFEKKSCMWFLVLHIDLLNIISDSICCIFKSSFRNVLILVWS